MTALRLEDLAAIYESRADESRNGYLDADTKSKENYYLGLYRGYSVCGEMLRAYLYAINK